MSGGAVLWGGCAVLLWGWLHRACARGPTMLALCVQPCRAGVQPFWGWGSDLAVRVFPALTDPPLPPCSLQDVPLRVQ